MTNPHKKFVYYDCCLCVVCLLGDQLIFIHVSNWCLFMYWFRVLAFFLYGKTEDWFTLLLKILFPQEGLIFPLYQINDIWRRLFSSYEKFLSFTPDFICMNLIWACLLLLNKVGNVYKMSFIHIWTWYGYYIIRLFPFCFHIISIEIYLLNFEIKKLPSP